MPLPMVHLSVAYNLIEQLEGEKVGAFFLGSIAPDSIHMRDGSSDEDKKRTHLYPETYKNDVNKLKKQYKIMINNKSNYK